jgi:hypothetical protein
LLPVRVEPCATPMKIRAERVVDQPNEGKYYMAMQ